MGFLHVTMRCLSLIAMFQVALQVVSDNLVPLDKMTPVQGEHTFRMSHKEDTNFVIHEVRMKPLSKSHFNIPICCMRALSLVRPINEIEVQRLEKKFVNGYREGDRAIYVSMYNDVGHDLDVSDDIVASWSSIWMEAN